MTVFPCSISKGNLSRGKINFAKGNKQHLVFTECLSDIYENPLLIKTCSLFQRVKDKRKGEGQHEIMQDPGLGTPLVGEVTLP